MKQYRFHGLRLKDSNGNDIRDSPNILVEKPKPYVIGIQHYIVLSKEDSNYFAQRTEAKQESSVTGDLLSQVMQALNSQVD